MSMYIAKINTAPRYQRDGITSYLLVSKRTGEAEQLAVTLVEMKPGGVQRMHSHEPEQIYHIVEGSGLMTVDGEQRQVYAGDTIFFSSFAEHGLENTGAIPLRYLSAASPSFTKEQCKEWWPLPSLDAGSPAPQMAQVHPGLTRVETFGVEEQHTAYHIGSGDERVLGTPWMISFMERVSNRLIAEHLPAGWMSVGTHVDVKHLAPTPIGAQIRVEVEILEVVKTRVQLAVSAWDAEEQIGAGFHTRAVVERGGFVQRAQLKSRQ